MATLKLDTRQQLYSILDALEEECLGGLEVRTIEGQSPEMVVGPTEHFDVLYDLAELPGLVRTSIEGDSFGGWKAGYSIGDLGILEALRSYEGLEKRSESETPKQDNVNHPSHYASESGLEAIEVIGAFFHENAFLANTFKYIARAGKKGGEAKRLEDLRKARWYLEREIKREEAR